MGYHNLPPSYDAWRLTPPWDVPRARSRFAPDTVRAPLCIEAPDVQIDAYGDYDADTGALRSVIIDGRHISPASVASAMRLLGHEPWGWDNDLDGDRLTELVAEAASDAEADWADRQRDMREDW